MIRLKEKNSPTRLESTTHTDLLSYTLKIGKKSFDIEIVICYESGNNKVRTISWIDLRIKANNLDYHQMWHNTNTTDNQKSFSYAIDLFLSFGIRDLYRKMSDQIIHDIFGKVARHCDHYMNIDMSFHIPADKEYLKEWKKEYEALKAKYKKENLARAKRENKDGCKHSKNSI